MAELLVSNGVPGANRLATHLSEVLPEEYIVVSEPEIRKRPLDVVVVGPQGLFVLHSKGWRGEIELSRRGPWREHLEDGRVEVHPNPSREASETAQAIREFLSDEGFPTRLALHQYIVLTDSDAVLVADGTTGVTEPPVVELDRLPTVITAHEPDKQGIRDAESRMLVAETIAEGYLGVTERTEQPFVFRSSGFLGIRRQAWTVQEAVRHMDRNPQDGIHHLRNDTLARWLSEQGAPHLASIAREVLRRHSSDPRAALEEFLIATRLVSRPRLRVSPRRISLGYVLAGQVASADIQLYRGRGRGYLYGYAEPVEPWVRVEPREFHRGVLQAAVIANTEGLLIQPRAYRTAIEVHSSASEEPISVPVHLRIMPMPSRFTQGLLRPLLAGVLAGILGLVIGMVATLSGLQVPGFVEQWVGGFPVLVFWPGIIGLFWFLLGVVRGANQAPAWPILYSAWRWLLRTLFWGAALGVLGVVVLLSGDQVAAETGLSVSQNLRLLVLTLAASLAALPATVGEIQASRAASRDVSPSFGRLARSPALLAGVGLAILILAVVGVRMFATARVMYEATDVGERLVGWLQEHLAILETNLKELMDDLYIHYYDRRAGG